MPIFQKQSLLNELSAAVQRVINEVRQLPDNSELLNCQPEPEKWSVLQVLGHLNYYNRAYLPKIEANMRSDKSNGQLFKTGWLGAYFTKMMQPKQDGTLVSKMSAPRDSKPEAALNARQVISEFIAGEEQLLRLLDQAMKVDLNARVPTSISSLIKLKAGDTFRFLVAHQQRHLLQLQRTLAIVKTH